MNKKTSKSPNPPAAACACQGLGPAMSEILRRLGPPAQARQHFETARIEILKGLRALVDARIAQISKARTKGEKIAVE